MSLVDDILAIVWIILGLMAIIFICFIWITWSRLPSKKDWVHAFVASFLSSRFVFCGLVLTTVAVVSLREKPWTKAECQLAFWAATTCGLSDVITIVTALAWACTQLSISCAIKPSTTRLITDIVVALVWVISTVISGLVVLLFGNNQLIVQDGDISCWMLPIPQQNDMCTTFLLFYFVCGVLITILASWNALRSSVYSRTSPVTSEESPTPVTPSSDSTISYITEDRPPRPACVPPLMLEGNKYTYMDANQRAMMLSVLASLTAFLNTIPHSVSHGLY